MLTYHLTDRKNMPIYEYLYKCIKEDILQGRIKAGDKLPSKRNFAKHLGVSTATVENAYSQLLLEGYVTSVEKSGFYVTELENAKSMSGKEERNFSKHGKKEKSAPLEEEFEYSFFSDLRSNRLQRANFPFSTWARLMRNTISSYDEALLKTVPYNGIYELREALCEYLRDNKGMQVEPSQIFVGSGTEYLYSRLIQLFGTDAKWAIENIGNQKIANIYDMYNARWSFVDTDEKGPLISSLLKEESNIVHISPSNNFPLGNVMQVKRRQELLAWAAQTKDRFILEDDYDSEFRYRGAPISPIFSMDTAGKVIYLNTFSKTLIPSLRISFMVLPQALVEKYQKKLSFYSGTVSSMEQYTLAHFIREGYYERHINHMRNYFRSIRDSLIDALDRSGLKDISTIIEPSAGTHFLLKLETDKSDRELTEAIRKKDIEVAALSEYLLTKSQDTHTLVINYCGIHKERIEETVERLTRAVLER